MPKKKEKAKIIPFDGNCKVCDREIPKMFTYCGSECRRKDLGIPTPRYMLISSKKSNSVRNVKRTKRGNCTKGQQRLD